MNSTRFTFLGEEKRGERAVGAAEGSRALPQPRSAYCPRKLWMCCWQWPRYPPPCRVELEISSKRRGHPMPSRAVLPTQPNPAALPARAGPVRPFLPRRRPRGGAEAPPLHRPGPAMLDFAIFAVTFLLILVGAVLYLYPVMLPALGRAAQGPARPPVQAGGGERPRARGSPGPVPWPWARALPPARTPGPGGTWQRPAGEAAGQGVPGTVHHVFPPVIRSPGVNPAFQRRDLLALHFCRPSGQICVENPTLQTWPFKSLRRHLSSNRMNNPGLASGTRHRLEVYRLSRFKACRCSMSSFCFMFVSSIGVENSSLLLESYRSCVKSEVHVDWCISFYSRHLGKHQASLGWLQLMKSKWILSPCWSSSALAEDAVHDQISSVFLRDGNLPDIIVSSSLHEFLVNLHEKYGPLVSFWFGRRLVVSLGSIDLLKQHINPNRLCKCLYVVFESICSGLAGHQRKGVRESWSFILHWKKMRLGSWYGGSGMTLVLLTGLEYQWPRVTAVQWPSRSQNACVFCHLSMGKCLRKASCSLITWQSKVNIL